MKKISNAVMMNHTMSNHVKHRSFHFTIYFHFHSTIPSKESF